MRLAICQINATVGDIAGNLHLLEEAAEKAVQLGADFAIFPELVLCGYPPEDLLLKPQFIQDCQEKIIKYPPQLSLPCLLGFPYLDTKSNTLYNSAALVYAGEIKAMYHKMLLPNYSVFDEKRYFTPGTKGLNLIINQHCFGVIICEDAWSVVGPAELEANAGAQTLLCLSASPFHKGKHFLREKTFKHLCTKLNVSLAYCNLVGGQDELVFDGGSFFMNNKGEIISRGPEFTSAVFCLDIVDKRQTSANIFPQKNVEVVKLGVNSWQKPEIKKIKIQKLDNLAEIYQCLVLGVRDYVCKNGFFKVVLGLSGGIDSSLCAAIAVAALGKENVTVVTMPSQYSSVETKNDAREQAKRLDIKLLEIPVKPLFDKTTEILEKIFIGQPQDLTEENLQARIRALYLMALSNKFNWLVLNTSNKSEAAVGYGTMYGDMIGAYSVLKDVFKTTVFALARFVNIQAAREIIPVSIIERPPSAELRPNQKDSDSLPCYASLDPVLEAYIEEDKSIEEMINIGFDAEIVKQAVFLTDKSEWKRRQSVPGVRVSPKAFGKDRRLPITNRYWG